MVVDDTIVVLENILRHRQLEADRVKAVSQGLKEIVPAVSIATGTSIAAFFPLLMMTGDMGQFLSSIPKVVIIALLAPLFECFIILPVHLYSHRGDERPAPLQGVVEKLALASASLSRQVLEHPRSSTVLLALLLAVTVVLAGQINFSLSKETEVRSLRVALEFSHDSDLRSVEAEVARVLDDLQQYSPALQARMGVSGLYQHGFHYEKQPYLATLELMLAPAAMPVAVARPLAEEILATVRGSVPSTTAVNISLDTNKPASGAAVKIYLCGPDADTLTTANSDLIAALENVPGITGLQDTGRRRSGKGLSYRPRSGTALWFASR